MRAAVGRRDRVVAEVRNLVVPLVRGRARVDPRRCAAGGDHRVLAYAVQLECERAARIGADVARTERVARLDRFGLTDRDTGDRTDVGRGGPPLLVGEVGSFGDTRRRARRVIGYSAYGWSPVPDATFQR
jgi:hypothetical protein